ncbi:uncharacterized protein A4U43_C08F15580 [Asparagus officinalis]|nr:uncharacterized protein A4U43_C08F15580 [Asparagus officinalis]
MGSQLPARAARHGEAQGQKAGAGGAVGARRRGREEEARGERGEGLRDVAAVPQDGRRDDPGSGGRRGETTEGRQVMTEEGRWGRPGTGGGGGVGEKGGSGG